MKTKQNMASTRNEQTLCPKCGLPQDQWTGAGSRRNDEVYCCEGCATGTGCTCTRAQENQPPEQPARKPAEPEPTERTGWDDPVRPRVSDSPETE